MRNWDRLTDILFLDDVHDLTFQPLLQLLIPVPHPPLQIRTLEAPVSQPSLSKTPPWCSRPSVACSYTESLSNFYRDTTRENELPEVFTYDFEVERDLLLAELCRANDSFQ